MVPSTRLLWIVAVGLLPLTAAAGLWPAARPVVMLLALLLALAAAFDAWNGRTMLAGITAAAASPLRAFRGRKSEVRISVSGADARTRMGIAWPPELTSETEEQWLDAGSSASVWPFTGHKRGEFRVPSAHFERASPLGLWDVRRAVPLDLTVRVLPVLDESDAVALRRQLAGAHAVRQIGKGREFEKLREYLPGDGLDEIHWKATARRGRPITKVFQVERTRDVYVVVDASRLTGRESGGTTRLERYISAALMLAAAAERSGDRFGVAAFQDRVVEMVRAGRGPSHLTLCRAALHKLTSSPIAPDYEEAAARLMTFARGRALLLFLTDLDDPAAARGFTSAARVLGRKHVVGAAMIRPPSAEPLFTREAASEGEIYAQLGGHMAWRGLESTRLDLARRGVMFVAAEERRLGAELAAVYDAVKQRQLV